MEDIQKNSEETDSRDVPNFNDIVSEGATVVLDAQDLIKKYYDIEILSKSSHGNKLGVQRAVKQSDDRSQTFSFVASICQR